MKSVLKKAIIYSKNIACVFGAMIYLKIKKNKEGIFKLIVVGFYYFFILNLYHGKGHQNIYFNVIFWEGDSKL